MGTWEVEGDWEGVDTDRERKVQKHAKMSRAK